MREDYCSRQSHQDHQHTDGNNCYHGWQGSLARGDKKPEVVTPMNHETLAR